VTVTLACWEAPPSRLVLGPEEIHLWRARLELAPPDLERLWHALSTPERQRARRLRLHHERRRFVAAHGVLRDILGRYLGLSAARVALRTGRNGKPELDASGGAPALWFNQARSRELALYCVSGTGPVGVDVEYVRRDFDWEPVAALLARGERDALQRTPADDRRAAFFRCWTRKEACLKATGEGLGGAPLDGFAVAVGPEPASAYGSWWLRTSEPADGYVAAVACRAGRGALARWEWTA
jgi:4'-phosphopantetheinyl transferase